MPRETQYATGSIEISRMQPGQMGHGQEDRGSTRMINFDVMDNPGGTKFLPYFLGSTAENEDHAMYNKEQAERILDTLPAPPGQPLLLEVGDWVPSNFTSMKELIPAGTVAPSIDPHFVPVSETLWVFAKTVLLPLGKVIGIRCIGAFMADVTSSQIVRARRALSKGEDRQSQSSWSAIRRFLVKEGIAPKPKGLSIIPFRSIATVLTLTLVHAVAVKVVAKVTDLTSLLILGAVGMHHHRPSVYVLSHLLRFTCVYPLQTLLDVQITKRREERWNEDGSALEGKPWVTCVAHFLKTCCNPVREATDFYATALQLIQHAEAADKEVPKENGGGEQPNSPATAGGGSTTQGEKSQQEVANDRLLKKVLASRVLWTGFSKFAVYSFSQGQLGLGLAHILFPIRGLVYLDRMSYVKYYLCTASWLAAFYPLRTARWFQVAKLARTVSPHASGEESGQGSSASSKKSWIQKTMTWLRSGECWTKFDVELLVMAYTFVNVYMTD